MLSSFLLLYCIEEGGALCWQLTVTHCDLPCVLARA
uniref:Uncharacterized protein n=1 Tax=Trichinella nativa TaxID=6335 RepID=A0A0V1KHV9_9BILA